MLLASSSSSSSEEEREVPPSKKLRVSTPKVLRKQLKHRTPSKNSSRMYQKKWEKDYTWLEYDADCDCKLCKTSGKSLERTGGVWTTKPFINWKKAGEKRKARAKSDAHIRATQASLAYQASLHAGSVIQQLQNVAKQQ